MVGIESAAKNADELASLGRVIAMHIANTNPVALDISGVPAETISRETEIIKDKNKDKKPELMEKIIAGGLKAYAKENCLLDQAFIMDTSKTIAQLIKETEGKAGGPIAISSFVRFALGEGIEKKEEDFAAEVAKTMSDAAAAAKK